MIKFTPDFYVSYRIVIICVVNIESNIHRGGISMNNPLYESVDRIYQQFRKFYQRSQIENDIENEHFPEKEPVIPTHKVAQFEELTVESQLTKPKSWYWELARNFMIAYAALTIVTGIMNSIMFAIWIFLLPGAAIIAVILRGVRTKQFYELKRQDVERIKSSKEYKHEYQRRLNDMKTRQYEFDKQYETELKEYNSNWNIWKENKKVWEADRQRRYEAAKSDRLYERDIIRQMFTEFGKFPKQYQFEECVSYVREVLATSDVDIQTAIEMYDRERQRRLESERIDALNRQAEIQEQRNRELAYQSELQERANDIAQKHRRESAAFGAYNAYQNSKQTRMMKDEQRQRERAKQQHERHARDAKIKRAVCDFNRNSRYH